MEYQNCVQSCLHLLEVLDRSNAWHLTLTQRQLYAERVAALVVKHKLQAGETLLTTMLTYYHTEHALVEALADTNHPNHTAIWRQLENQARALLASKLAARSLGDGAVGLDDLTQEVITDLWRGLNTFRYHSRLQTWVFTITSHCLNRAIRTHQAQKRTSMAQAQSLDALTETQGDTLPDQYGLSPEETAQGRELSKLLRQVLANDPDRRLATVLQLWAVENYSLREIGSRMQLSVGRVHGLLAQAQALLRSHPSLQAWTEHTPTTPLAVNAVTASAENAASQGEHSDGERLYKE